MIVKCNKSNDKTCDKFFAVLVPTKFEITDSKEINDKLLVFFLVEYERRNKNIRIY